MAEDLKLGALSEGNNWYRVTYGGDVRIVQAPDKKEAHAQANDDRKKWPGPKQTKVELLETYEDNAKRREEKPKAAPKTKADAK